MTQEQLVQWRALMSKCHNRRQNRIHVGSATQRALLLAVNEIVEMYTNCPHDFTTTLKGVTTCRCCKRQVSQTFTS
jgi:hypothetical protein